MKTLSLSRPSVTRRPLNEGYTLMELIVTIAVIGALMVLLVPTLSSARERSRRVTCLSHMRQLGLAMTLYSAESGTILPPYLYESQPLGDGQYALAIKSGWSLANVGTSATLNNFVCPSDRNPSEIQTTDANGQPITIAASYSYNFMPLITGSRAVTLHPGKIALLFDGKPDQAVGTWWGIPDGSADSSGKVTICHQGNSLSVSESAIGSHNGGHAPGPKNHPPCYLGPCAGSESANLGQINSSGQQILERRHAGNANVLFLDCHAEWLPALPAGSLLNQ